MEFRILGPLEAHGDAGPIAVGGRQQRALLTLFLLSPNTPIGGSVLIDRLWPELPPRTAPTALRVLLSQLRRVLEPARHPDEPARLERVSTGWSLRVEPGEIDAERFEASVDEGRKALARGDPGAAVRAWREGLALWRGPALVDLADDVQEARAAAARWNELRLSTLEECVQAELQLGRHGQLVPELEALVAEYPFRERLIAAFMLALYRSGRQAEALRVYGDARERLVEELGIDPDHQLVELERGILRHDPALDLDPFATDAASGSVKAGDGLISAHLETDAQAPLVPSRLPVPATSFVGRERELGTLAEARAQARLVSLVGAGGCGKTRLALELARRIAAEQPNGVAFVDLAMVDEPVFVADAVAGALGLQDHAGATIDFLCARLRDHHLVLVIDNCEHVVEACADLVAALLDRCLSIEVITTSREVLEVEGERVITVPPLALPAAPASMSADERAPILEAEAVQLFIERARAVDSSFALDDANLQAIAAICRRLDGIPLAIELAAPLAASLSAADVAQGLDDRFALLFGARRRGSVARQATLRAALNWSFNLLSPRERELFAHLAVFTGEFTLPAANAIVDHDVRMHLHESLIALIKKSMVVVVHGSGSTSSTRYRLLETLRAYGWERLVEAGRADMIRRRHAAYYLGFAERVHEQMHGPDARHWLELAWHEVPNLRSAVAWAFDSEEHEYALRLAGALHFFFSRMGNLEELCQWLDRALTQELPPNLRLLAVSARNTLSFSVGDYTRASDLGEEAIALAEMLGDRRQHLIALAVRGGVAVYEGKPERAQECFDQAMELCDELSDRWAEGWVFTGAGVAARRAGHHEEAERQLERALVNFRSLGDNHGLTLPLINLAMLAQAKGDLARAEARCEEAIAAARRLGHRQLLHVGVCTLGRIRLDGGELDAARELLIAALEGFRGSEQWLMVAIAFEGLALIAAKRDRLGDAAVLVGYAGELRARYGIPLTADRTAERTRLLAEVDHRLGIDKRDRLLQLGAQLGPDDVLRRAAAATAGRPSPHHDATQTKESAHAGAPAG